jgi:hypothetical protein
MKRLIYRSCAAVLMLTALFKLNGAAYEVGVLTLANPIVLFLTNRQVLLVAAMVEAAVGVALIRSKSDWVRTYYLSWLVILFATYRAWMVYLGIGEPCRCLGSVGQWIGISTRAADRLSLALLGYLTLCAVLLWSTLARAALINRRNAGPLPLQHEGRAFGREDL